MKLVAIVMQDVRPAREALAMLDVIQRELVALPDHACAVTKDLAGVVRLRQVVTLTGRGARAGSFWCALLERLLQQPGDRRGLGLSAQFADAVRATLRPGISTILVLARGPCERLHVLAEAVGAHVLETPLSYAAEAELHLARSLASPSAEVPS